VQAMASHNKTLAEIDLLTGKAPNSHTNDQTGNRSE
jgi:hypothetical protein